MFGWIARAGLLRFLGRRAVPLLAAWQVVQLVRGFRKNSAETRTMTPAKGPAARTLEDRRRRS